MPEPHCCVKKNCRGERYAELKLNCMYCGNSVYIQCMRERKNNEKIVKNLLKIFGLATSAHDGTFIVNTSDNEMLTKFNDTFIIDSPFAISCEVCSDNFKKMFNTNIQQQHQQNASSSPHSEPLLSVMALSHPHPEPLLSEIALANNITNNQTDNKFAIYVSKFKPTTTCDKLAAYITHKTSLVYDTNFSIEMLTKKSKKQHKLNFVSFKINTSNKDDYDVIMNSELWGSVVDAKPFVPPQKPPKPSNKKINVNSKQKPKQKKVQQQQQQQQHRFSSQNYKLENDRNKFQNMHQKRKSKYQVHSRDEHVKYNHQFNGMPFNMNTRNGHSLMDHNHIPMYSQKYQHRDLGPTHNWQYSSQQPSFADPFWNLNQFQQPPIQHFMPQTGAPYFQSSNQSFPIQQYQQGPYFHHQ